MSAENWTPGPWWTNFWSAHVMPDKQRFVPADEGKPICAMLWPTDARSEAETKANADLIAAAPNLYAELRDLVEDPDAGLFETEYDGQMVTMCCYCGYNGFVQEEHDPGCPILTGRKALAKARGETS